MDALENSRGKGGFGLLLRQYRERRGPSQNRLARSLGLSPSTVNMLESDQRHPSRDTVIALASALGLTVSETDNLLVAARHLPTVYEQLALDDPDLRLAAELLVSADIPADRKQLFRQLLRVGAALCGRQPEDPVTPGEDGILC